MIVRRHQRHRHALTLGAAFVVALMGCSLSLPAGATDSPPISRVRSSDPVITALIDLATAHSPTFRLLRLRFESSDGMVYIEPGTCGHGARACLKMWMSVSGPYRFLRILVDRQKAHSDVDFMGSIGHELQHALEALSQPSTSDGARLYNFFGREAPTDNNRFETMSRDRCRRRDSTRVARSLRSYLDRKGLRSLAVRIQGKPRRLTAAPTLSRRAVTSWRC